MADDVDEHGLPLFPAAERNKQPILEQLQSVLPDQEGLRLLELAAGTGQHAVHFARRLPHVQYTPSDYDAQHLNTLRARVRVSGPPNLKAPIRIDVREESWPITQVDVIYNANMIHIAPFEVTHGLLRGAGRLLSKGGLLVTYGPYRLAGAHTSESNERFDRSLRTRDPNWGVRDLEDLAEIGRENGLFLREKRPMPANNFFVVWDRV